MTAKAWKADTSNTAKNRPVCRPLGPLPGSDHCRPGLISPGRDYVSPAGLSAQPGRIGHASPCSLCEQRFQSAQHLISRHPTLSVLENTHLPENQCEERWLHPFLTCLNNKRPVRQNSNASAGARDQMVGRLKTCPTTTQQTSAGITMMRSLNVRSHNSRFPHRRSLRGELLETRWCLATFVVTNLQDAVVANPGDAPGTLRQAVYDANTRSGPDEIRFDPGLSGTIGLEFGELTITDDVIIDGPGARIITLDASPSDPTPNTDNGDGRRVLNVDDGTDTEIQVQVSGLTFTGGDVDGDGGGIFASENIILNDAVVTGNYASDDGGGFYFSRTPDFDAAHATITNTTLRENTAGDSGGGLSLYNRGQIILRTSRITHTERWVIAASAAVSDR